MKTTCEKRAIKIVELQEELEEAKEIIYNFVFPSDSTEQTHQAFLKKAARFIGTQAHFSEKKNYLNNLNLIQKKYKQ
jgi:hypothetical protein